MKTTKILLAILILSLKTTLFSQDISPTITFNSKALNEERIATIQVPADYDDQSDNLYPVMYVLDGRTHERHAASAVDFLSRYNLMPGVIVVSVYNVDRNRDFTPVKNERNQVSGGAKPFMQYLSGELKKKVDKKYRTSGFDILVGHSLGGMFAAYALTDYPGVFDGYIALSPYLQYANDYMVTRAGEVIPESVPEQSFFYMTVGNEPNYFDPLSKFAKIVNEEAGSVDFKYEKLENDTHASIPYIGLFNGLKYIFSDWALPGEMMEKGLEAIDSHYSNLSKKYGIKITTPEFVINRMGYQYLADGNVEKAIEIFRINVERYPKSANVHDSLGEAYETAGDFTKAAAQYKQAYENGLLRLDPNVLIYEANWERVREK